MPFNWDLKSTPYAPLGIIPLRGCEKLARSISNYIKDGRMSILSEQRNNLDYKGYWRDGKKLEIDTDDNSSDNIHDSYIIKAVFQRFATGEGKVTLIDSVRGYDIYIICDCFNHGETYKMFGEDHIFSPDDYIQDLKRVIDAIEGKAKRINLIMPMLYCGRQHRRTFRESLDCADMLQSIYAMGVSNILTFDAHDASVQNAIPMCGMDSITPAYQMIKAFANYIKKEDESFSFDSNNLVIISPDEGAMKRCIYYSQNFNLELGMFYKLRDLSPSTDGKSTIKVHRYLGKDITDKDVIVIDDMIASGDSMLDVCKQIKAQGARRIFIFSTFGLFTEGFDRFDKAYEQGWFNRIFTTNGIYQSPELLERQSKWYTSVKLDKYMGLFIHTLNHDESISQLLNPTERIIEKLDELEIPHNIARPKVK